MATHRSAKKAERQSGRARLRNRSIHSAIRTQVRKAERVIATEQLTEADSAVLGAIRALDSAAQKGVVHRNQAARSKSRLMRKYNVAKGAAAGS